MRVTQLQKDLSDHLVLVYIEHQRTLPGHKQQGLLLVSWHLTLQSLQVTLQYLVEAFINGPFPASWLPLLVISCLYRYLGFHESSQHATVNISCDFHLPT